MFKMARLIRHGSKILAFSASAGLLMVSSAVASSGLAALYAKYSPEKQIPTEANCHLPTIKGEQAELEDISVYIEKRREVANQKGYIRTEHEYQIPALPLVSMNGEKTTLDKELQSDKPVMLNFIFTTCTTICPVLSASFYQLQNELGEESRDVKMISISIDPEYDTPKKLKTYAERFNAGPQWQFYTGETDDIVAIERAFGAFRGAKMNHEPLTFIRAKDSQPWVRINGIASAEDIVSEYRSLVATDQLQSMN